MPSLPQLNKMAEGEDVDMEIAKESKTMQTVDAFKEKDEVLQIMENVSVSCDDDIALETDIEKLTSILDVYQEQPYLLDPHLEEMVCKCLKIVRNNDVQEKAFHQTFRYLYLICKTRGSKYTLRMFSHEVADLEPVIQLINQQNILDFTTWQTRYVLLLWLSIICIIPFDLIKFDSSCSETNHGIIDSILNICKIYLKVTDKSRDAAALLLAKFMSRPDVKQQCLSNIIDWLLDTLVNAETIYAEGLNSTFGILTALHYLLKFGDREDLLSYANHILSNVEEKDFLSTNNILLKKLTVKLYQRLGLCFLKPKVPNWRYQRGNRSLLYNLENPFGFKDNCHQSEPVKDESEESYNVPENVELVLQKILLGLQDRDTVVRWSAAKGIGRIACRLPKDLVNDIISTILEYFSHLEANTGWHGGCLALAELGKRGLLLPERLSEVVPVVAKSLIFDEKRGKFNAGAHVRDAACYVCWSFARAYDPKDLTDYLPTIASSLIVVSIFDREPNCRRAASAAFQEHVGRQGKFPHGIDILTAVDYFSVGNIKNCYLNLSAFVAKFSEYTRALVDHLVFEKVAHWDSNIRELSSKSLAKLTPISADYMKTEVLPFVLQYTKSIDLNERHGGILSTAELIWALCRYFGDSFPRYLVSNGMLQALQDIIPFLERKGYFSGVEGDFMKIAACKLIENLSISKLPFKIDYVIEYWQEIIDHCLPHTIPEIQEIAANTLNELCKCFYQTSDFLPVLDVQEILVERYLAKLKSNLKFERMGFALGLGAFPAFFFQGKKRAIINGLLNATIIDDQNAGNFAESRRDAVKSLTRISKELGLSVDHVSDVALNEDELLQIMECFLRCLEDYSTDRRGDVGAWVRESAMSGLEQLTNIIISKRSSWFSPTVVTKMFCGLVQQAAEKIDRTRAHAGEILHRLIHLKPSIPNVPHHEALKNFLPSMEIGQINWAAPAIAFPIITKMLLLPSYRKPVMLGLIVSAGGLTESLVRFSLQSLLQFIQSIQNNDEATDVFMNELMGILEDNQKKDRITVPLLRVIDLFISNGCLDVYLQRPRPDMLEKLHLLVKNEVSRSGDAKKLVNAIKIYCGLIQFSGEVRRKSLSQLMIMLCHKYPRVRRETAADLYTAFITFEDIVKEECLDQILALLSETEWDVCVEDLWKTRNDLCFLLEVPVPKLKKRNERKDSGAELDSLESYQGGSSKRKTYMTKIREDTKLNTFMTKLNTFMIFFYPCYETISALFRFGYSPWLLEQMANYENLSSEQVFVMNF